MGIEAISKDVMLLIFYKGDDVILFDNPWSLQCLIKALTLHCGMCPYCGGVLIERYHTIDIFKVL